MYRNARGRIFSGNTQIIIVELTKLDKALRKPVPEMSAMEKWAIYLKYGNHKGKKELIRDIRENMEDIKMGAQVLETISSNRDEFLNHFYQLKAEIDRESEIHYAKKVVREELALVIADKDAEITGLRSENADKDAKLADKDAEIAKLKEQLANRE